MAGNYYIVGFEETLKVLDAGAVRKAMARARKRGTVAAGKALTPAIQKELPLKAGEIKKALEVRAPHGSQPGLITITSTATPLNYLKPRKLGSGGYSVEIQKGRRVRFTSAFELPRTRGKRSVGRLFLRDGTFSFPKRGNYGGAGIRREGIQQLFTRSIPQAADDPETLDVVVTECQSATRKEFLRQIGLMAEGKL